MTLPVYFYGITKIASSSFPASIFQEKVIFHQTLTCQLVQIDLVQQL